MNFTTLLLGHHDERSLERIGVTLDRMDPRSRVATVLSIKPKELAELWELVSGRNVDARHFVPADAGALKPVIHHGKNSMPTFSRFQKRFCVPETEATEVYGYNHQPFLWATGPGYFVGSTSSEADAPASFLIDYARLPAKVPEGWPRIVPNSTRLGPIVYAGQVDYVRGVSEHVCIGRLYRRGKSRDIWFILCREAAA